jgi:hypothetical protein
MATAEDAEDANAPNAKRAAAADAYGRDALSPEAGFVYPGRKMRARAAARKQWAMGDDPRPPPHAPMFAKGLEAHIVVFMEDLRRVASPVMVQVPPHDGLVFDEYGASPSHARYDRERWRTRMCWHFAQGRCARSCCPYAHGVAELRPRPRSSW